MNKANESLTKEIVALINRKQEGGYWDFKQQWHENKAELLHDIICLANNLENHDAYLIFGVKENRDKTWDICGINEDDENRLDTLKVVDSLRDKRFIGDVRPMARVETIIIEGKKLDILIIENSHNTPFRLKKDFSYTNKNNRGKSIKRTVLAKSVYTRVQDANTPIDKTADPDKEEKLWRKRFHMDESVYDKTIYYLKKPDDWEESGVDLSDCYIASDETKYPNLKLYRRASGSHYYYKYAPEHSIELVDNYYEELCDNYDKDGNGGKSNKMVWLSGSDIGMIVKYLLRDDGIIDKCVVRVNGNVIHEVGILRSFSAIGGIPLIAPRQEEVFPAGRSVRVKVNDDGKPLLDEPRGLTLFYIIKGSFDDVINEFIIDKQRKMCNGSLISKIEYGLKEWDSHFIKFESEDEKDKFVKYIREKYSNDKLYDEAMENAHSLEDDLNIPSFVDKNKIKAGEAPYKYMQITMSEYRKWKEANSSKK